mmetsp:Transcript_32097/g.52389  ORF Transcript_32097/g.52389 Transcript_32097/m.52389 type:complete len:106 (-) Transcript_32097:2361-2678(-)
MIDQPNTTSSKWSIVIMISWHCHQWCILVIMDPLFRISIHFDGSIAQLQQQKPIPANKEQKKKEEQTATKVKNNINQAKNSCLIGWWWPWWEERQCFTNDAVIHH